MADSFSDNQQLESNLEEKGDSRAGLRSAHGTTPYPWGPGPKVAPSAHYLMPLSRLISCYGMSQNFCSSLFFLVLARSRSMVRTVTPNMVASSGFV